MKFSGGLKHEELMQGDCRVCELINEAGLSPVSPLLRCCKLITKLEMRAAAHFMQPDAKINQDSDFLQIRVYIKVNQKLNILS